MKHHCIAALALAVSVSACSSSGSNPSRLYLALLRSELTVQLVAEEPDPF